MGISSARSSFRPIFRCWHVTSHHSRDSGCIAASRSSGSRRPLPSSFERIVSDHQRASGVRHGFVDLPNLTQELGQLDQELPARSPVLPSLRGVQRLLELAFAIWPGLRARCGLTSIQASSGCSGFPGPAAPWGRAQRCEIDPSEDLREAGIDDVSSTSSSSTGSLEFGVFGPP